MNDNWNELMQPEADAFAADMQRDEVAQLTAENEDLRRKLAIAVDMVKCNADRIDALVTAVEGMDANAITGDAPTGQAIVLYDDYNLLIELARSMRNGTQVDGDTHLSGYAAENAALRAQLRILVEGDEAADELIMMFRAEIQHVVNSNAVSGEAKAKSRAILAKIDAYHEKYT